MGIRAVRAGAALAALQFALVAACSGGTQERPLSGVLITLDTTIQTALGAYGQPLDASPHLD